MTLLAGLMLAEGTFLLVSDGVALAEDSSSGEQVFVPERKIFRCSRMPGIVFGFAGGQAVGSQCRAWIDRQAFRTWDELLSDVAESLARLNGEAVRRARVAEAAPPEAVVLLIGGILGGETRVAFLDEHGSPTPDPSTPVFIGTGDVPATLAWAVAEELLGDVARTRDAFCRVVGVLCERLPGLAGPVQVLEAGP